MVLSLLGARLASNDDNLHCLLRLAQEARDAPATSPRAAADGVGGARPNASAPQAGDEGSSGSTKDRQRRRTFVGIRALGERCKDGPAPRDLRDEATAASDHPGSGDAAFTDRGIAMDAPSG